MHIRKYLWKFGDSLSILILISILNYRVQGVAIDNSVVGDPVVECLDDRIRFWSNTQKYFAGRIYAKGRASIPACTHSDYASQQTTKPHYDVMFGQCGMNSLRSVDPRGMYYGITVVVSFHPLFITKVDQAYHVKCFFEEANRGITAELGVSMIPTTEVGAHHGIPGCTYSIHKSTISQLDTGYSAGPPIQFARVGDKILHRWECADDMFGVLINNCYVTDGFGQRAEVVDNRGCPLDPILITGIRYAANLTVAYAESHVFKFADKPGVWFFCQIQMCMKGAGMCRGLTPPTCADGVISTGGGYTGAPSSGGYSGGANQGGSYTRGGQSGQTYGGQSPPPSAGTYLPPPTAGGGDYNGNQHFKPPTNYGNENTGGGYPGGETTGPPVGTGYPDYPEIPFYRNSQVEKTSQEVTQVYDIPIPVVFEKDDMNGGITLENKKLVVDVSFDDPITAEPKPKYPSTNKTTVKFPQKIQFLDDAESRRFLKKSRRRFPMKQAHDQPIPLDENNATTSIIETISDGKRDVMAKIESQESKDDVISHEKSRDKELLAKALTKTPRDSEKLTTVAYDESTSTTETDENTNEQIVDMSELSGQLIVYDIDEDPPSFLSLSKASLASNDPIEVSSGSVGPDETEGFRSQHRAVGGIGGQRGGTRKSPRTSDPCVISAQSLLVLLLACGGIICFLSFVVLVLFLRVRRSPKSVGNDDLSPPTVTSYAQKTLAAYTKQKKMGDSQVSLYHTETKGHQRRFEEFERR